MDSLAAIAAIGNLLSDACLNTEKLAGAMISSGLIEAVTAAQLIICKPPQGILVHHGKAPYILYYTFLVASLIFGLLEILTGFWVQDDLVGRRAAGKMILRLSIFPLIFVVAALGAFSTMPV